MKKLKFGVVGAGAARGQWWISTIAKLIDRFDLIGICEPLVDRHRENQERWKVPMFASLVEMIEAEKPEVVLCAVPPDGNPVVAQVAARHGIHVVSEIPVAPTRRLADSMDQVARENGVKLEIAENVYRWPVERLKRKILDAGLIGDIRLVRLSYITGSYHGFNAVRVLMGCEAKRVMGFTRDLRYPMYDEYMKLQLETQRWGAAVIEFENGATCWYEKAVLGGSGRQFWDVEGSEGNLTPEGLQRGKAQPPDRLAYQSSYVQVNGAEVLDRMWVDSDPVVEFRNPYAPYGIGRAEDLDEVARADILVRFHEAIVNDQPVAYPVDRAWPDQELVIAVEESQRRGNQWVSLPLDRDGAVQQEMHAAYRTLYGHDPEDVDALIGAPMPRGGVRCDVLGDM